MGGEYEQRYSNRTGRVMEDPQDLAISIDPLLSHSSWLRLSTEIFIYCTVRDPITVLHP